MNFSMSGLGITNQTSFKMAGASNLATVKFSGKRTPDEKKDDKNSTAAILSISNPLTIDRSKAITKQYQSMKDSMKKQIDGLNERLKAASEQGDTELEKQLAENIKDLTGAFTALDEELNAALFREQQRKAEEEKKKQEEASKKQEKEQEKFKPKEEQIKDSERKKFEFFTKTEIARDNIQNGKLLKAKMESSKTRLEGEMSVDAARAADRAQLQKARMSEHAYGVSQVPYVSDKSIITEKARIRAGSLTPAEQSSIGELSKLTEGIYGLQNKVNGKLAEINVLIGEHIESENDASVVKMDVSNDKLENDISGDNTEKQADIEVGQRDNTKKQEDKVEEQGDTEKE